MQAFLASSRCRALAPSSIVCAARSPTYSVRHASLTSAINRGIYRSKSLEQGRRGGSGPPQRDDRRDSTASRRSPREFGRPPRESERRPSREFGRSSRDFGGRTSTEHAERSSRDFGRPSRDFGRPSRDFGRPSRDFGRSPREPLRTPREAGRPLKASRPSREHGDRPRDRERTKPRDSDDRRHNNARPTRGERHPDRGLEAQERWRRPDGQIYVQHRDRRQREMFVDSPPTDVRAGPREAETQGREERGSLRDSRTRERGREGGRERKEVKMEEADDDADSKAWVKQKTRSYPVSIPYTTAASEFLYGTSSVRAALTSRPGPQRKLYKLYIHAGHNRTSSAATRDDDLERLARRAAVPIVRVRDVDGLRMLDKMSASRPHNGYVLEASPLPQPPITALGALRTNARGAVEGFAIVRDHQTREDAAVNGTHDFVTVPPTTATPGCTPRRPLVLLLDGITDPGNLGAIIRSAAFLGVAAVVLAAHSTAPLTPVALKAAAGAAEAVPLLTARRVDDFVTASRAGGWKVYAAVAPQAPSADTRPPPAKHRVPPALSTHDLQAPLTRDACLLMLGSEGEGLRASLQRLADAGVSIPAAAGGGARHGVDSLNVSVAAGILCDAFLRPATEVAESVPATEHGGVTERAETGVESAVTEETDADSKKEDDLKLF